MLRIRLGNINLGKGQDGPNRFIPKRCWTKKVTQILKNISDKWKSKGADCFLPCIIKKIHIVKLYCFTSVWAKNWTKLLKPHKIYSRDKCLLAHSVSVLRIFLSRSQHPFKCSSVFSKLTKTLIHSPQKQQDRLVVGDQARPFYYGRQLQR